MASSSRCWTPGSVVVKECACGNKVKFDPVEDLPAYASETDTVKGEDFDADSDYGSYDRRREENDAGANGIYYAKFVDAVGGGREKSAPPPARPPPPSDYYSLPRKLPDGGALKRSQSLQQFSAGGPNPPTLPYWMMETADTVPDFPTPFDRFVSTSNIYLNRT